MRATGLLLSLLAFSACEKGDLGAACKSNSDCKSGLCLDHDGGYCSFDCAVDPDCPGACRAAGDIEACYKGCADASECRPGYQCFQGVCQPGCTDPAECGSGYSCDDGQCNELPGAAIGERCKRDSDCSSRVCDPNTLHCQRGCRTEADCPSAETCAVNLVDADFDDVTEGIRPICVRQRGGGVQGAPCKTDKECNRGFCQLGVCTVFCDTTAQCGTSLPMVCLQMWMPVDDRNASPEIRSCVFRSGVFDVSMGDNVEANTRFALPSNIQSLAFHVAVDGYSTTYWTGLSALEAPGGKALYWSPKTSSEFYDLPVRYYPSEGNSMMLVPNSPEVKLGPGLYTYSPFAVADNGRVAKYSTTMRVRLGDGPLAAGRIPLHVFLAARKNTCTTFKPGDKTFESTIKTIFAQVGVTVDPITYTDVSTADSITVEDSGTSVELDNLLAEATDGDDRDVLEAVIVKSINSSRGGGYEILGIAGGIPGAVGIPGTPHSGAALALDALCYQGYDGFAMTAAHELGHTLGLFHNVEQDRQTSPLGDDVAQGSSNLMYWLAESSHGKGQTKLSPNQGAVIRNNPAIAE